MEIFVCPSQPLPVGSITPAPAPSLSPLATYFLALGAVSVKTRLLPPLLHAAASWMLTMVDPGLPRLPRSVAEVLGTGSILSELAAILAEHSWTVHKEGLVRTPEERTGRGLHAFLLYLAFGEVTVSGLEKITLVGVDKDGRVYLMHLLFSVRVNIYLTECRLFACVGELPAEPPPR